MKGIRLEALAIFALFFGVAMLDAFQAHDWIRAALWLTIGSVFLVADNLKKHT
jgi:hypothetical protein